MLQSLRDGVKPRYGHGNYAPVTLKGVSHLRFLFLIYKIHMVSEVENILLYMKCVLLLGWESHCLCYCVWLAICLWIGLVVNYKNSWHV